MAGVSTSHEMGLHTEPLKGRDIKTMFKLENEGGYGYAFAADVDFNKRCEVECEGREAVDPSTFRIQVHELGSFPRVFADRLQSIVFDRIRNETFFVLQFHSVEGTTVRVDTDEKFFLTFNFKHLCIISF